MKLYTCKTFQKWMKIGPPFPSIFGNGTYLVDGNKFFKVVLSLHTRIIPPLLLINNVKYTNPKVRNCFSIAPLEEASTTYNFIAKYVVAM